MTQLLCIVGPTGTGKTALAVCKAQEQPSILISADSRQVYRGMDIMTGKDHPPGLTLHGIDLVNPDEPCSVSVWYDAVLPVITQAWGEGKRVIVVGGTGLYIRALTQGIATISVPINPSLRAELQGLSVTKLQAKLSQLDPVKFNVLNHSDAHNPRRLIRAIEIAMSPQFSQLKSKILNLPAMLHKPLQAGLKSKMIGLHYSDTSKYQSIIEKRVLARLGGGAVEETNILLKHYSPTLPSMTAIGYRSIIRHIQGEITAAELITQWTHDELAYAKRQLTWFNKDKSIKWYDITKGNYGHPQN